MKTKQDLIQWFDNLTGQAIKNKVLTQMLNGVPVFKTGDIEDDKQNVLLIRDIIQKYKFPELLEQSGGENVTK